MPATTTMVHVMDAARAGRDIWEALDEYYSHQGAYALAIQLANLRNHLMNLGPGAPLQAVIAQHLELAEKHAPNAQ